MFGRPLNTQLSVLLGIWLSVGGWLLVFVCEEVEVLSVRGSINLLAHGALGVLDVDTVGTWCTQG